MNRSVWSGAARWLLLPVAVWAVACTDSDLGVDPSAPDAAEAHLSVFVELGSASVGQLAVEVTAPDMETLYFNLVIDDGMAAGILTLRAGADRTITLRAFDHAGTETHRGSTTIDVVEGSNPAVSILLEALGEGDPMEGIVGDYHLLPITAGWPYDAFWDAFLGHRFASLQLTAHVVDGDGDTIAVPIHWAGTGLNALGVASAPPWDPGAATMVVTATAIAGTQARQVRVAFQHWAPVEPVAMMHARQFRTCGLNEEGQAFCWGSQILAPSPVDTDVRFSTIATGGHTCAVALDGSAWCWGFGAFGQLGDGSSNTSLVPVRAASEETFTAIGVGIAQGRQSCGLTEAGDVWCWGVNDLGQLGDGSFDWSAVPVRAASDQEFRSLTVGFAHACALTVNDDAYCWGNNFNGKVGDGSSTNRNLPVPVAGGLKFASISAATQVTCGLTTDDDLYCWGGATPWFPGGLTPVLIPTEQTFAAVSVGGADTGHHMCGLTAAGTAYCWGANAAGQLGDGSTTTTSEPVPVAGGLTVRQITAGIDHTCAVTADSHAYCWGANAFGQVGDLSRDSSSVPVRVVAPTP